MAHHTKDKGDLAVFKAMSDLGSKGYIILNPLTEHAPFDICIYKDGVFKRIQVKYRTCIKGRLEIRMESTWSDKNGIHKKSMDKNEVDLLCVYCPESEECYYFDPKVCNKCMTLRIVKPLNNQPCHMASDYREVP